MTEKSNFPTAFELRTPAHAKDSVPMTKHHLIRLRPLEYDLISIAIQISRLRSNNDFFANSAIDAAIKVIAEQGNAEQRSRMENLISQMRGK